MAKFDIKSCLPHAKAIFVFLIISVLYFTPDVFEGKTLIQSDVRNNSGIGQEGGDYYKKTGERTLWTNSAFGGMPTYQIAPSYDSTRQVSKIMNIYHLFLPSPIFWVFIMLLGFYILLTVLNVRSDIAILGAIAYAFSSYFFIIIEAGHIWKLLTLAYIPPTIAGIALAYKGKYLAGGILTGIFMTFQIISNHVQMTYYFLFVILAYVIAVFIDCLKEHKLPHFIKASATVGIAVLIALMINGTNLFHTYQYSKETIRGKSELTHNIDNKSAGGLDKSYIVDWSYGLGETWTLLIPNTKGGASGYLGESDQINDIPQQYRQAIAGQNHYWGDQPFTSGPVYAGAFIMTLFVMGLFLVKTRLKWALLAVTVLSILLAWGKNFMGFTDLFIDYFPMYSKFRTVSSILVIAEFTIPLLAILMLVEIVKNPKILIEQKKKVYISFGLTGGFALLFALFPTVFFSFLSQQEAGAYLSQAAGNPQVREILDALEEIRSSIFRSDAWRTVIIIALGGGLLFALVKNKINSKVFVILLTLLCLFDMWSVNKRYLNSSRFTKQQKQLSNEQLFPKTQADVDILKDKDPNFRVFNTTSNAFNDATTSYYHKSLGGYHGAKLRRYQDLIEHHLSKGNMNVFNMLNAKYFIVKDKAGNIVAQYNPTASGNAWFVDSIRWVNNADEEIEALTDFDPLKTAFVDTRFQKDFPSASIAKDSTSVIRLTSYKPNELIYKSESAHEGFAVFSEIYYPHGWSATIDGKPASVVRTDYVLRGIVIPAGVHEIVFTFKPQSIKNTEAIAYGGMALLAIAIGVFFFLKYRRKKKEEGV